MIFKVSEDYYDVKKSANWIKANLYEQVLKFVFNNFFNFEIK